VDKQNKVSRGLRGLTARERIYKSYFSGHLSSIRNPTHDEFEAAIPVWRARLKNWLPEDKQSSILELGCGYGALLHFLCSEGYENVKGVDLSGEQVALAKSFGAINVVEADVRKYLAKDDADYGLILAFDLLEHLDLDEQLDVLDLIGDHLKPNGLFVFQVPNADGPFSGRYRYSDLTHHTSFTKTSVRALLNASDLELVAAMPAEPVVHGVVSAIRWILWKCIRAALLFYMLVETGSARDHIFTQNMLVVCRLNKRSSQRPAL
jgi:SAM-dependent methyltransferase